jgi:hypothetical protein
MPEGSASDPLVRELLLILVTAVMSYCANEKLKTSLPAEIVTNWVPSTA